MRRHWRRVAGALVVALAMVVGTAVLVVRSDWLRDRLRRLAVTEADRFLAGQLSIGRLSGSLLHGVVLDDVRLTEPDGLAFEARRVTVSYDPMQFVHRHFVLGTVVIERPVVRAVEGPEGWNVAHLLKPTSGGRPVDVQIERLRLLDGDVTIGPRAAAPHHLNGLTVDSRLSRIDGHLSLDVAEATFHDDPTGYTVRRASGSLRDGVQNVDVSFDADEAGAHVAGRVRLSTDAAGPHLVAAVDLANVNLRAFLTDPQWQSALTGHADVEGTVGAGLAGTTLRYQVAASHALAFGYEGRALTASGTWRGRELAFVASASAYGGAATIKATWRLPPSGAPQSVFDGVGTFRQASLSALPASLHLPPFESRLAGHYQVHKDPRDWHANVVLDASTVAETSIAAGTVGSVESQGGVLTYTASGSVEQLNVQQLAGPLDLPSLDAARYRSRLTGSFDVSGREICHDCEVPRELRASVELSNGTLADSQIPHATATLTLVGEKLTIATSGAVGHLTAETLGLPTTTVLDLNGTVDGTVTLPDLRQPISVKTADVTGTVALGPSQAAGIAIDHAEGDLALENGTLTTHQLLAEASGLRLRATGTVSAGESGASALDVTVDSDDLRALGTRLGQPLEGAGTVEAHLSGPFDHPEATGRITLRQVAYGSDARALTFNGTVSAAMPNWQVGQATVALTSQAAFVTVKSVNITNVAGTVRYANDRVTLDADLAEAGRELKVSGDLGLAAADRALEIHTLALTTNGQTWTLPAGRTASIKAAQSRVEVRGLTLTKGPSSVDLEGVWPLSTEVATSADRMTVQIQALQLSDVNPLAARHLTGVANAEATLTGTLDDPHLIGQVDIENGVVETTPFASLKAAVTLAAHDLTVDGTLVQSGTNALRATGHVPVGTGSLASPRPMSISLTSTPIDLGLAQLVTPSLSKMSGTGQVNLTVTGSPQAPIVDGTIRVDGGAFTLTGAGVSYRNATAALSFKANHLAIDALEVEDHDGHALQAVGGVDVFGDPAHRGFNVHVTSSGIHVLDNELGTLQVGADVQLSGDFASPKVAGKLSLESGRLQVDRILQKTTKGAYSETPEGEVATATPGAAPTAGPGGPAAPAQKGLSDRVTIDVQINLPDNLVMRGRKLRVGDSSVGLGDMNVIAGGQMHVVKAAGGQLDIIGGIQIVRGTYTFQGRRFDVSRGSDVQFRGEDVTNPALNLSADQTVNGIDATVHVGGTAKRPELTLSSQPPLDQAEILSLIVFGQSVGDLASSDRTSLADSAAAMAGGMVTTPLADSIAQALDLDTFEILAPTATEAAPVVSVGSTIGSRIYVGLKREVGGTSSAVSFEYRFTRFLRLVTSFAQGALETHVLERTEAAGIDLLFVFRF
jgi:autotransporter translocation and assembly factor TamB